MPDIGAREQEALARALSGGYYGCGPETAALERELEAYLGGGRHAVCVATGTSALHVALAALDLAGGEVLVPSLTFVATFQAVRMAGAVPVACDVQPADALLDLADARRRIGRRTRAIVPVHYAGNPGALDAVYDFAAAHGLRVVEDAAHACGTRIGDVPVGARGDVVCFSFDPIKNITAGQGGAVLVEDARLAQRLRVMRDLGIDRSAPPVTPDAGYDVALPGWRYAMSDLNAAIGRVQLARFDDEIRPARVRLAAQYRERLAHVPAVRLLDSRPGTVPHIFPIRVPAACRDVVRAALAAAGFETRVHYPPNHLLAAFRDGAPRPGAEAVYAELLSLPCHSGVAASHVEAIGAVLERALAGGAPARFA
jgi:dTDP-4-amino-4,6-dideoxygalactose transaminase